MSVQAGEEAHSEKAKYGKLTKLGSIRAPHQHPFHAQVNPGQELEGEYPQDPEVGKRFTIYVPFENYKGRCEHVKTSEVTFIYHVDENGDEEYVAYEELWPVMEILDRLPLRVGDVLFSTLNSIYWLKRKDHK